MWFFPYFLVYVYEFGFNMIRISMLTHVLAEKYNEDDSAHKGNCKKICIDFDYVKLVNESSNFKNWDIYRRVRSLIKLSKGSVFIPMNSTMILNFWPNHENELNWSPLIIGEVDGGLTSGLMCFTKIYIWSIMYRGH